jgi:hypothetical protein
VLYGAETGHFIRNTSEVLKLGAGWRSVGPILWVLRKVKEGRNILRAIKKGKVNWIGHILRRNCLLKHIIEGKVEGGIEATGGKEEDVSSYWMTSRKGMDTVNWKRKH